MPTLPIQFQQQPHDDNVEPMELDFSDEVDVPTELPVIDELQIDLESFVAPYDGLSRVLRLEFIADHCKSLREAALRMSLDYLKATSSNVKDYVRLFKKLEEAIAGMQTRSSPYSANGYLKPDTAWIDVKTKQAALRHQRLESELKNFKASFIRENLRRAQDDLGQHYLDCGDLNAAFGAYSKAAEYASQANKTNEYLNVIHVGVLLKHWSAVQSYVLSTRQIMSNESAAQSKSQSTHLLCAAALSNMAMKQYREAAENLIKTNYDDFEKDKSAILSPINIVAYSCLCALATFGRRELATQIINSASFRQFSELDPQFREAVTCFYESKYSDCLSLLQDLKPNLMLDIYLAPHVEALYKIIRDRALIQYFEPYSSACLRRMAISFSANNVDELEREIINLICDGQLNARIDSNQKILYASDVDTRGQIFERALAMGKQWQRQARALISRTAILNAGLKVNKKISDNSTKLWQAEALQSSE